MMHQLKEISPAERHWLLVSVAHILIADHIYETSEKEFFEKIMKQIFHREAEAMASELEKILDGSDISPIEPINIINPSHLVFFLDVLSAAVYASGKMLHSESLKFFDAGLCIGLDPGTLSYRLNLERERMLAQQKLDSFRNKLELDLNQKATAKQKVYDRC